MISYAFGTSACSVIIKKHLVVSLLVVQHGEQLAGYRMSLKESPAIRKVIETTIIPKANLRTFPP